MTPAEPPPAEHLYTITEVAARLRISKMSVYRLVRIGELDAIRVGHLLRISHSALEDFLSRGSAVTF